MGKGYQPHPLLSPFPYTEREKGLEEIPPSPSLKREGMIGKNPLLTPFKKGRDEKRNPSILPLTPSLRRREDIGAGKNPIQTRRGNALL
jgi:hypothetical protein